VRWTSNINKFGVNAVDAGEQTLKQHSVLGGGA
jgi:hypothetical protein